MGVSAPQQVLGYMAFAAYRLENARSGVSILYTPPLDTEPGITIRAYPIPDTARATYVRDEFAAELARMARPRNVGPQPEVEPAQEIAVVGSDGVTYRGWRSTSGTPGSRALAHRYAFEKEAHVVRYDFSDDGLNPMVTPEGARAFIEASIGEISIQPLLRNEVASRPSPPRPVSNPVVRPPPRPAPYEGATDDVHEAVARWAFQNAETDLDPPAAYCIGVSGGRPTAPRFVDPSAAFLARFSDLDVPVRPTSGCYRIAGGPPMDSLMRHSVMDAASGEFGLAFDLPPVTWTGTSTAEAGVLYQQGMSWGGGWSCQVESSEPRRWRVLECRRTVDF